MASESVNIEKALISRVATGDQTAFRELFDRYKNRIYSFAMYLTRSEAISEEITQEIFIKIWTNREQLHEINYFNAWLKTVIRNFTYSYLRRLAHEQLILKKIHSKTSEEDFTTNNTLDARDFSNTVAQAIEQLPQQQKRVYLLSRQEHLKYEEIAKRMNISPNTVRKHLVEALRSIRRFVDNQNETNIIIALALFFSDL